MTTYPAGRAAADVRARRHVRRTTTPAETRPEHERQERQATPNVDQILDDSFPASDPPSWTSSISHVASSAERQPGSERLVRRIQAEYLEMPGLCLTIEQAQRLWSLEPHTCEALLDSLIDLRFLRRTDRGLFVLRRSRG